MTEVCVLFLFGGADELLYKRLFVEWLVFLKFILLLLLLQIPIYLFLLFTHIKSHCSVLTPTIGSLTSCMYCLPVLSFSTFITLNCFWFLFHILSLFQDFQYYYHLLWLHYLRHLYEGVSKSFWTGHLEWELQMVQLSATRCSCIAMSRVSLVSFAIITLCVASQWVFIVHFVMTQCGNFWIHPCIFHSCKGDWQILWNSSTVEFCHIG
jgi:hypothetical protein